MHFLSENVTNIFVSKLFGFAKNVFCIFSTFFYIACSLDKSIIYFFLHYLHISSRELKTSEFSLMLLSRENYDVFNTLDEYIWYSPKKPKYLLFTQNALNYKQIRDINSGRTFLTKLKTQHHTHSIIFIKTSWH